MATYILKCIQPYFNYTWGEYKLFEVRKHDRDFQIGDYVLLREYDAVAKVYGPRAIVTEISYLMDDLTYCKEGYVIFSIKIIRRMDDFDQEKT